MSDHNETIMTRKAYREQKAKNKFKSRETTHEGGKKEKTPEFHFKNRDKQYEPNKTRFYTREIKLDQYEIQEHLKRMQQHDETSHNEMHENPVHTFDSTDTNDQETVTDSKNNNNHFWQLKWGRQKQEPDTLEKQDEQPEPTQDTVSDFWGKTKVERFLNIGITSLLIGIVILTLIAFFI